MIDRPTAAVRIAAILADRAASTWIHSALLEAIRRDPADAASDAEILAETLVQRAEEHAESLAGASPLPASQTMTMASKTLTKGQFLALKALIDCIDGRRIAPDPRDATWSLVDQAYEHAKGVYGGLVSKEDIATMYSTPISNFI